MMNRCNNKEWFSVKKIDDETYIIFEKESSQQNACFLIIGSERAIMFDSGTGENKTSKIKNIVKKLTNVPVVLLLSHFHFDHTQNIDEFHDIAFPELEILKNKISSDSTYYFSFREVLADYPKKIKVNKWLPINEKIDLGNRNIEIIYTPGHTDESITIIDKDRKYLFTGDLLYNGLLLVDDFKKYEKSLKSLLDKTDMNYRIFGSHSIPEVRYKKLQRAYNAMVYFQTNKCIPHSQIDFFGIEKDVFEYNGIVIIKDYIDKFEEIHGK